MLARSADTSDPAGWEMFATGTFEAAAYASAGAVDVATGISSRLLPPLLLALLVAGSVETAVLLAVIEMADDVSASSRLP